MPASLSEAKIYDPYDVYLFTIGNDRLEYARLTDKLKKLPARLQDFIFDTEPGDFIKDRISIRQSLNENQSKELAILILELILADVYLGNIVNEIQKRLTVDQIKAKTIAGLIVAELFGPILDDLKKIHVEKFAKNLPDRQKNDDRIVDLRNNL